MNGCFPNSFYSNQIEDDGTPGGTRTHGILLRSRPTAFAKSCQRRRYRRGFSKFGQFSATHFLLRFPRFSYLLPLFSATCVTFS